jgi:hypothetical protein
MSERSQRLAATLKSKAAVSNIIWPRFARAIEAGQITEARVMRDEVRGAYDDMAEALRALGDSVVADADAALMALEQGEETNG